MLSTLLYATKLKTNSAQVLARTVKRGISVQVTSDAFLRFTPHCFGSDENYSRRAFCTDRPKPRRLARLRPSGTRRLSLGESTFTDSRVSRWSGLLRPTVESGTDVAHRPTAHKVKPDQVEAYKKAASVIHCFSRHCEELILISSKHREEYYTGIIKDPELCTKLSGSWETLVGEQDTFCEELTPFSFPVPVNSTFFRSPYPGV